MARRSAAGRSAARKAGRLAGPGCEGGAGSFIDPSRTPRVGSTRGRGSGVRYPGGRPDRRRQRRDHQRGFLPRGCVAWPVHRRGRHGGTCWRRDRLAPGGGDHPGLRAGGAGARATDCSGRRAGVEESALPDVLREAVEGACRIFRHRPRGARLRRNGHHRHGRAGGRPDRLHRPCGRQPVLSPSGGADLPGLRGSLARQRAAEGRRDQPDEAKHSRFKNIITRSVGFEQQVQVDLDGRRAGAGRHASSSAATASRTWSRTRRSSTVAGAARETPPAG